ncbi:MAG: PD40 domain-containing protein [Deltaproteobacteria bacterium]|nr:PD40 domain-containing protein [Candidatus Anaeroferrophillus wilburensis]MBN2888094.1 PD40 domain-containing protein [Deltaproteobacteria bacterium]
MRRLIMRLSTFSTTTATMFLLLVCSQLLLANSCHSKVYLEINQPNIRKIPLAIAPLQPMGGQDKMIEIAAPFRDVMVSDLDFSTFFEVIADPSTYLEDSQKAGISLGTFDFRDWSLTGAELLIKGGYYRTAEQLVLELRLFNVFSQNMIFGKRYRGRPEDHRLIAHKFCNEVVQTITGLPGEFSSKIAFVATKTEHGIKEIYTMDYDGNGLQQVTSNGGINLSPTWSHDVTKLAYTSYKRNNPDLYILDFSRGREKLIADKKGLNTAAEWSQTNQQFVLMQSFEDNAEIAIISTTTGQLIRRLTNNWASDASPCWAPSGKEIAFVSDRAGSPQIYIMDHRGKDLRRITHTGNYNAHPDWSSHTNKIVFSSIIDNAFQICSIDPDGRNLLQLSFLKGDNEDPCWSPNGRHIVFTSSASGVKQLMIMDLHGHNLKEITNGVMEKQSPSWSNNQ